MRPSGWAALIAGMMLCHAATAAPPDCEAFSQNDRMEPRDQRWCQALAFKSSYLKGGSFAETAPAASGSARLVSSKLSSGFSTGGATRIAGSVSLGAVEGFVRLTLATTRNTMYYGRNLRITGRIRTEGAPLEIYSPVDVDLWKLAAVLIDGADPAAPPPEDGLVLKGFVVRHVPVGDDMAFTASLASFGGDYALLLNAPEGTAQDVMITIDGS